MIRLSGRIEPPELHQLKYFQLAFFLAYRPPPYCNRPLHRGPCRAYIPSYGYNAGANECQRFIFGGCRSNGNRFSTIDACNRICMGQF